MESKLLKEEFDVLNKYQEILYRWSMGCSTTVTRIMWNDLYPIVKKYSGYSGSLGCSYCAMKLCEISFLLWDKYRKEIESEAVVEEVKPKRKRNVKKEEKDTE